MPNITRRGLAVLALLLVFHPLAGCGDDAQHSRVANYPPFVQITGGPPEGKEDSYTARVWWTGWDDDGIIAHYEYAIDPDPVFSEAEVNAPERSEGISRLRILGPEVGTDTLRFSKIVDGRTHSFDFVQTREFSRSFSFSTPRADSAISGGTLLRPLPRFSGYHTLYVRSADNEGDYSDTDRLAYTAVSLTPSASVVRPRIGAEYLTVGTQITVHWDGIDPDSPEATKRPAGYIYKLVKLDSLNPPLGLLGARNPDYIMNRAARHIPWTYQSAETTSAGFFLEAPAPYMFAVRAVDVSGAVEPFLDFVRAGQPGNVFAFQALSGGGRPALTVSEPSLGTYTTRGQGAVDYEVPVGKKLRFTWTASAEVYGGVIEGYNYGIDVQDLDRDGPNTRWQGWSTLRGNLTPIVFNTPGTHVISVKTRDAAGATTICSIILRVIDFPLDREILVVDDYRDTVSPRDEEHDAFWMGLLENSGRFTAPDLLPERVMFHAHGNRDAEFFTPIKPSLEQLGRYRTIVWETRGGGAGGSNALLQTGPLTRHLAAYLGAGGQIWIAGEQTIASTIPTETDLANFDYPHEIRPGMFAWEFLKLYTGKVDNPEYMQTDIQGLLRVDPFPGRPEVFPTMEVDAAKQRPGIGGSFGIGGTDLIMEPIFEGSEPRFRGQIDSLYVYRNFGQTKTPPRGSIYAGRLCAVRWHDPDPEREQGRTMWFGFSLYYLRTQQVQETFNRAIDWFREERPEEP